MLGRRDGATAFAELKCLIGLASLNHQTSTRFKFAKNSKLVSINSRASLGNLFRVGDW